LGAGQGSGLGRESQTDGPTIVSVYMSNNTSACDKQAAEMDKNEKDIVRQGYRLIAE